MGRSISAIKTSEDDKYVYYDYDFRTVLGSKLETVVGKITIDKVTDEVHFELAPGDSGSNADAAMIGKIREWAKGCSFLLGINKEPF